MLCKEGRKSDEVGVIQVFKMKGNPCKLKKNNFPMIFLAITKKGFPPQYMKYEELKKEYPYLLIDFFEKRLRVTSLNQYPVPKQPGKDQACQTQKRQRKDEMKEKKDEMKEKKQQIKDKKEQPKQKNKDTKQIFIRQREINERQLMNNRQQRETTVRESVRQKEVNEPRPFRSCRNRNDPFKRREDYQFRQDYRQPPKNLDQEFLNQQIQARSSFTDDQNFKKKSYKKILDYDNMIEELGLFNLVSPAVIPASKSKVEVPFINYHIPARINFKQIDREQYSSQEFKESEESEFVLDERGKEKRRRQKLMRQQQKLNKRKKLKKIKKKKKVSNRQN